MMACSRCGIAQPLTNFSKSNRTKNGHRTTCKKCVSAEGVEYRARLGSQILSARAKAYRDGVDPAVLAAKDAAKYLKNKEIRNKQAREYYLANRERMIFVSKQWRIDNPEAKRASHATRRARKKMADGTHTQADIKALMTLQKHQCPVCRASIKDSYHIDHIKPLAAGGSNDRTNIQLLCPPCNMSKSSKDPIDFMQKRGFLL